MATMFKISYVLSLIIAVLSAVTLIIDFLSISEHGHILRDGAKILIYLTFISSLFLKRNRNIIIITSSLLIIASVLLEIYTVAEIYIGPNLISGGAFLFEISILVLIIALFLINSISAYRAIRESEHSAGSTTIR